MTKTMIIITKLLCASVSYVYLTLPCALINSKLSHLKWCFKLYKLPSFNITGKKPLHCFAISSFVCTTEEATRKWIRLLKSLHKILLHTCIIREIKRNILTWKTFSIKGLKEKRSNLHKSIGHTEQQNSLDLTQCFELH